MNIINQPIFQVMSSSVLVGGIAKVFGGSVGLMNGIGFTSLQKVVCENVEKKIKKYILEKKFFEKEQAKNIAFYASNILGGVAAFAVSRMDILLGFSVTAPISVPVAVALTVTSVALPILFKVIAEKMKPLTENEENKNDDFKEDSSGIFKNSFENIDDPNKIECSYSKGQYSY